MRDFFSDIKKNAARVRKFNEENKTARENTPLAVMLLNDSLPLLTVVAYLLIGFLGGFWHPGWILFFLIPIYYMTISCVKHKSAFLFPVPLIVTAIYLLIGFLANAWHPYWAIYCILPVYYAAVGVIINKNFSKIFDILVPLLVVAVYLILGFVGGWWHPGWAVFFAIPLYYQIKITIGKYKARRPGRGNTNETDDTDGSIDGEIN